MKFDLVFTVFSQTAMRLWLPLASAQTPGLAPAIVLAQLGSAAAQPVMAMRAQVPLAASIESISAQPQLFTQTFDPLKAYSFDDAHATWLHFRVLADDKPSPTGWMLSLSKPYINRAEFYQKDATGAWRMQAAGDYIAHNQWPVRALQPQFALPVMAPGEHEFYLKINHASALHFSVNLQRTDVATQNTHYSFLLGGILFGVSALMLAFGCARAFIFKERLYGWYALFVVLSGLATASHMGLSNYALWPGATTWPIYSTYSLIMAALIAQLQFCRSMFLPSRPSFWWQHGVSVAIVVCAAMLGMFFITNDAVLRQVLYALVACLSVSLVVGLVLRAWHKTNWSAWLYMLAYLPLLVLTANSSIDSFGFMSIYGTSVNSPVYALIFEVPVLLIALHLHTKTQHTQEVRESVLASLDPLTGFVTSQLFEDTAEQMWDEGRQRKRDMVVAYVEASSNAKHSVMHTVRMLRTVVRDTDIVAHVDNRLFAILQPEKSVGDELSSRLSRLVVLGQMTDKNHSDSAPVHFRIVASSLKSFVGEWHELDHALRQKLRLSAGWDRRRIRFVVKNDSEKFETLWMRAVAASAEAPATAKKA
jgi:two-component system, sensor histidine kinase LadS